MPVKQECVVLEALPCLDHLNLRLGHRKHSRETDSTGQDPEIKRTKRQWQKAASDGCLIEEMLNQGR